MTSALVSTSNGPGAPMLTADLLAVGIEVVGEADCTVLLHDAIRDAPDLIIVYAASPDAALFGSTAAIAVTAPRPVVVFTNDPDADKIDQATRSGVHAYVVNGYGPHRLRSVIHLAQARFRSERLIRGELSDVSQRFAERTLVDRAKGILMGARQLREEEAYRALRTAAMHSKQRIGQVAQQVIDSARYAEAVNRAGQLRMLSQRLVKLYALLAAPAGADAVTTRGLFTNSLAQVENNLAILGRILSQPTFGDLLAAVLAPWGVLRTALQAPPVVARLRSVDELAEEVLLRAEQLTVNLEIAGFAAQLRVINVSGRQRMLSQRVAKEALLATLLDGKAAAEARAAMTRTAEALDNGLAYLIQLPLSNADIGAELAAAAAAWHDLRAALAQAETQAGLVALARLSETLLGHCDRSTDHLERAMQALIG